MQRCGGAKDGGVFDISDIALRIVGAFYAFAGIVATRAMLMSYFLDRAISALSREKLSKAEVGRSVWLGIASVFIFVGGVALAILHEAAAWIFLASATAQAVYLAILAPFIFDRADPPDGKGRQQSINAFAVYLAATAFVLWAASSGHLQQTADHQPAIIAVAIVATVAFLGYVVTTLYNLTKPAPATTYDSDDVSNGDPADADLADVTKIKVMADYQCWPLWNLSGSYHNIAPGDLDLSDELVDDLLRWAVDFDSSLNADNPAESLWTDAEFLAHEVRGRQLAERLKAERPELLVYVLEPKIGVVEIRADDRPNATSPSAP